MSASTDDPVGTARARAGGDGEPDHPGWHGNYVLLNASPAVPCDARNGEACAPPRRSPAQVAGGSAMRAVRVSAAGRSPDRMAWV